MKTISIDIETFSSEDLSKCGVYKYCESPDFEILLFGYSIDGGEVKVIDLAAGEKIPEEVILSLTDDSVLKFADYCSNGVAGCSHVSKRNCFGCADVDSANSADGNNNCRNFDIKC